MMRQTAKPPASRRPLTPPMLEALQALADGEMTCFRVGYARTVKGPFYPFGTIEGLWKRDLIDLSNRNAAKTRIAINRAGRAALEAQLVPPAQGAAA